MMSIRFACAQCGHAIDVDDRLAGHKGHCKHCGHPMTIPAEAQAEAPETAGSPAAAFKLRPIEGIDAPAAAPAHPAPGPALRVRPLAAAESAPAAVQPPAADPRPIEVLDPDGLLAQQAHRTHLNPHYETRLARFAARFLRTTRDRLYLLTLALLVVVLIGFLFKLKPLLHLGSVGVVATNILMLVDGVFYLIVLPFRDSLAKGLGTLLVPPYAVYYWFRNWGHLKKPLTSTVGSFLPIALAGLAYFLYEESPVIWSKVEQADRAVEKAVGIEPGPAPAPRPARPSVADQAKQVLGNEANIIQQLAQPQ